MQLIALFGLVLLFLCGCSNGNYGMYAAGYEYVLAGGEPYGFTGDWQGDTHALETADELLGGRTIEFHSGLSIKTDPNWNDDSDLEDSSASSQIGHYMFAPLDWRAGEEEFYYGGYASIENGQMKIIFNKDSGGTLLPVRIEYVFDVDEAQALVDSLKGWRSNGSIRSKVSNNTFEAVVKLNGKQNGIPWELVCTQEISCVAVKWNVM